MNTTWAYLVTLGLRLARGSTLNQPLHSEGLGRLGLLEVLAAAVVLKVEVPPSLQLEAVLIHQQPHQTPLLPRLPRGDIRLRYHNFSFQFSSSFRKPELE